uniref:Uncharacterized protein n=1 Tax=mine drainage metagenome TaxID=410659 RepID=E6QI35_9ZZZZ
MRIAINLATRPYTDQRPALRQLRLGMAVLAVILALLALGMLHFHQAALRMAAQQQSMDLAIAKLQNEQQGYKNQMQQPANARVLTQADFLNQLFDEKSFSWTETMEDLETTLPAGVQVTAIEPVRDKEGNLTLHLRVSGNRDRVVDLLRAMEHSPRFVSPRIVGENAESGNGPGGLQPISDSMRVNFDILAEYSQATLAQRKAALNARNHPNPQTKQNASSSAQKSSAKAARKPSAVKTRAASPPKMRGGPMPPRPGSGVPR